CAGRARSDAPCSRIPPAAFIGGPSGGSSGGRLRARADREPDRLSASILATLPSRGHDLLPIALVLRRAGHRVPSVALGGGPSPDNSPTLFRPARLSPRTRLTRPRRSGVIRRGGGIDDDDHDFSTCRAA